MNHLANLLTTLKQNSVRGHEEIIVSSNKLVLAVLDLMKKFNYINEYTALEKGKVKIILSYANSIPAINEFKVISKPGSRVYRDYTKLTKVLGGRGIQIVSTSKGVMDSVQAKKLLLGGEVICEIY